MVCFRFIAFLKFTTIKKINFWSLPNIFLFVTWVQNHKFEIKMFMSWEQPTAAPTGRFLDIHSERCFIVQSKHFCHIFRSEMVVKDNDSLIFVFRFQNTFQQIRWFYFDLRVYILSHIYQIFSKLLTYGLKI